jgi:hypothetical protein
MGIFCFVFLSTHTTRVNPTALNPPFSLYFKTVTKNKNKIKIKKGNIAF